MRAARVLQPVQHRPERLFPLPRRRERQRGKSSEVGSDSSDAHSGTVSRPRQSVLLEAVEQPLEPGLWRLLAIERERALVEIDGRVQPRVLEVRRAAPLDDGRVHLSFHHLSQDVLLHRVNQARLAQARLADQQHDLPHAFAGLLPAIHQQADLLVTAGQG